MSHEKTIADLAYHLWHARGCPHGSSEIDWAEAERQVRGRPADRALDAPVPANGLAHSTPAGNPPAAGKSPRAAAAKPAESVAQVDKPVPVEKKPSRAEKPATRVASDQASPPAADSPVTRTKKKTKR